MKFRQLTGPLQTKPHTDATGHQRLGVPVPTSPVAEGFSGLAAAHSA